MNRDVCLEKIILFRLRVMFKLIEKLNTRGFNEDFGFVYSMWDCEISFVVR